MTPEEFYIWFQGFVEAIEKSTTRQLSVEQWNVIMDKLKLVNTNQLTYLPKDNKFNPWDVIIQPLGRKCDCGNENNKTCYNISCPRKLIVTHMSNTYEFKNKELLKD